MVTLPWMCVVIIKFGNCRFIFGTKTGWEVGSLECSGIRWEVAGLGCSGQEISQNFWEKFGTQKQDRECRPLNKTTSSLLQLKQVLQINFF